MEVAVSAATDAPAHASALSPIHPEAIAIVDFQGRCS